MVHMFCLDFSVQVLEQAWPFFGMYMEKFLKETIQPTVRLSNPALKTFTFTKIHFGHRVSFCPVYIVLHYSFEKQIAKFVTKPNSELLENKQFRIFIYLFLFQPLKITGMKAFTHEVDQREVVLDLKLRLTTTFT